jgi:hypothetical protein
MVKGNARKHSVAKLTPGEKEKLLLERLDKGLRRMQQNTINLKRIQNIAWLQEMVIALQALRQMRQEPQEGAD